MEVLPRVGKCLPARGVLRRLSQLFETLRKLAVFESFGRIGNALLLTESLPFSSHTATRTLMSRKRLWNTGRFPKRPALAGGRLGSAYGGGVMLRRNSGDRGELFLALIYPVLPLIFSAKDRADRSPPVHAIRTWATHDGPLDKRSDTEQESG